MKRLLACCALFLPLLAACSARAATPDDRYLHDVRISVRASDVVGSNSNYVLTVGHAICDSATSGTSKAEIAQLLVAANPDKPQRLLDAMFSRAHEDLCPTAPW